MGNLDGQVAFITGAARGQGRAHAVKLAGQGADIIAVDICGQIPSVQYAMATEADLADTVAAVESLGRRIVARRADVRDLAGLRAAYKEGRDALGPVTIVVANAGIHPAGTFGDEAPQAWQDAIDVILTGTWNTLQVTVPDMVEAGRGGSIAIISSTNGVKAHTDGSGGWDGYSAAKHGVVGLMRAYAWKLGPDKIRVNTVHPSGVPTGMTQNEMFGKYAMASPEELPRLGNRMPVEWLDPEDIANAVAWLASDEARYITGAMLPVDAGSLIL
jgi:SDR family mycofactocin-dependent oxidoreductase